MKKRIIYLSLGFVMTIFACSKTESVTPAADCTASSSNYEKLFNAWLADPTNKTKCQATINAIAPLLNCPGITAAAKKEYQDLINSNPCK
jgi:hypothetical protein